MLYINDPKQPYKTYDEVVNVAVEHGIEPKRVYIYLAAFGVKSALARALAYDGVGYLPAVKVAIKDNKIVSNASFCNKCKQLVIK